MNPDEVFDSINLTNTKAVKAAIEFISQSKKELSLASPIISFNGKVLNVHFYTKDYALVAKIDHDGRTRICVSNDALGLSQEFDWIGTVPSEALPLLGRSVVRDLQDSATSGSE
jgi:hypothetical protein